MLSSVTLSTQIKYQNVKGKITKLMAEKNIGKSLTKEEVKEFLKKTVQTTSQKLMNWIT